MEMLVNIFAEMIDMKAEAGGKLVNYFQCRVTDAIAFNFIFYTESACDRELA